MTPNSRHHRPRGLALPMAVVCLTVLTIVFGILTRQALSARRAARAEERRLRAGWLAESGLERAWARLAADPGYRGETWDLSAEALKDHHGAAVVIAVEPVSGDDEHLRVTARADFPRDVDAHARQTRTALFPAHRTRTSPSGDSR